LIQNFYPNFSAHASLVPQPNRWERDPASFLYQQGGWSDDGIPSTAKTGLFTAFLSKQNFFLSRELAAQALAYLSVRLKCSSFKNVGSSL